MEKQFACQGEPDSGHGEPDVHCDCDQEGRLA